MKKLVCLFVFVLLLQGCSKNEVKLESDEITIYMVEGNEYFDHCIRSFYTDIKLNVEQFETSDELASQYAAQAAIGKAPDVVLCSLGSKLDIYKLIKSGAICDAKDYLDLSVGYLDGIVKGGQYNEKQYIIPFTFDASLCTISDNVFEELGQPSLKQAQFADFAQTMLGINSSFKDYDGVMLGLSMTFSKPTDRINALAYFSGLQLFDENGEMVVTKEQLTILCELYQAIVENMTTIYPQIMKEDNFFEHIGVAAQLSNPISSSRQMEMYTNAYLDCGLKLYAVPSFNGDNSYTAMIHQFGFVSADSGNKTEAYRLLKFILDYNNTSAYESMYGASVNRSRYFAQIDEWKYLSETLDYKSPEKKIKVEQMSNDTYQVLADLADHISYTSIPNYNLEEILTRCMSGYLSGANDLDQSYEELKNNIELYLFE